MRFLALVISIFSLATATQTLAKDKTVAFVLPNGVTQTYVSGLPSIGWNGKQIEAIMMINSVIISGNERPVFSLVINNHGAAPVNLDATTVTAYGDDASPIHIYSEAELAKQADGKDKSRRLWHGIILGLASSGGTATTTTTGEIAPPGQLPTQFTSTSETTLPPDPAAQQAAIAAERARLDAAHGKDVQIAQTGLVPATVAPGDHQGTHLTTDAPKKGYMMIEVKSGEDDFKFVFSVQ